MPAFASETKCDDATMKKIDADISAMKDAAMKDQAMKDFSMAKAAIKKNKMADCETHLEGAMKNIM
jgi:hypothetical protein